MEEFVRGLAQRLTKASSPEWCSRPGTDEEVTLPGVASSNSLTPEVGAPA
jgi:hypothetical protein